MAKWVYSFGDGRAEGRAEMKSLLGGKGANLAEMSNLGLPVPPGFTITTEVCGAYYANDRKYPDDLKAQVQKALATVEQITGRRFGHPARPLLVSVRSGARASMPGMMDTILNLGLNDKTVEGLAKSSGDPRFAYDSYRRFIQMYSDVVLGVDHHHCEELIEQHKHDVDAQLDTDLKAKDWQEVVRGFHDKVKQELGQPFPQDPKEQLWGAICPDEQCRPLLEKQLVFRDSTHLDGNFAARLSDALGAKLDEAVESIRTAKTDNNTPATRSAQRE